MGSVISSLTGGVGGNSGGAGLSYQAGSANIQQPTTADQANQQYQNAQNALTQQQQFLNAVQAQNGLGNQSAVYNQLQGVANGTGPNPAQAQLAQATGANTANQAALMAGQRGAGANAGLIARQAAQQGAANQQNAAGQAATMQANQSLNALNSMGQLATNQANQQANATQAYNNSAQGEQGQILGSIGAQNQAAIGNQSSQNSANAGVSAAAAQGQSNLIGNIFGGAGAALGLAKGGTVSVPQMLAYGTTDLQASSTPATGPSSRIGQYFNSQQNASAPLTGTAQAGNTIGQAVGQAGKWLYNQGMSAATGGTYNQPDMTGVGDFVTPDAAVQAGMQQAGPSSAIGDIGSLDAMAGGGKVPALLSPGEKYLTPKQAKEVVKKGKDPIKEGKTVPGKPKVPGAVNSYANDTVPAKLDEGGIVIPRSITQGPNPHARAMKFVAAHLAKNGKALPKKGRHV